MPFKGPSTKELKTMVEDAVEGRQNARDRLFTRYWEVIQDTVRAKKRRMEPGLRRREDTQDLAQQAASRILTELKHYEWQGKPAFFGWLRALSRSTVSDAARHHRAQKRDTGAETEIPLTAAAEGASPEQEAATREQLAQLVKAVESLKSDQASALVLYHMGHTYVEIAEALSTTAEAARKMVVRSERKLRKKMKA